MGLKNLFDFRYILIIFLCLCSLPMFSQGQYRIGFIPFSLHSMKFENGNKINSINMGYHAGVYFPWSEKSKIKIGFVAFQLVTQTIYKGVTSKGAYGFKFTVDNKRTIYRRLKWPVSFELLYGGFKESKLVDFKNYFGFGYSSGLAYDTNSGSFDITMNTGYFLNDAYKLAGSMRYFALSYRHNVYK